MQPASRPYECVESRRSKARISTELDGHRAYAAAAGILQSDTEMQDELLYDTWGSTSPVSTVKMQVLVGEYSTASTSAIIMKCEDV